MSAPADGSGEMHLAAESIDALAQRLAELVGVVSEAPEPAARGTKKMVSPAEVSELWGVSRRWVYRHAEALGVRRLGAGPRARLRFDPEEIAERLGAPRRRYGTGDGKRLTAIARFPHSDSLSRHRRAIVAESQIDAAGRRTNAPGPASKEVLRRASQPSLAGLAPPPPPPGKRGGDCDGKASEGQRGTER